MKRSTEIKLRKLIERIISEESNDSKDLSRPFWVISKGGSIGSNADLKYYYPGKGQIIKTFDTKEEAQEYAKRRRKNLSKGERSYYGMGYIVVPGTPSMRQYLKNK